MKNQSIGIDLEEVSRFKNIPFAKNRDFYKKVFTKKEILYCLTKANPYPHFTARFCAKEALIKAVGKGIDFKEIEVVNTSGRPKIKVGSKSKLNLKNLNIILTPTHTKNMAAAVVLITS